MLVAELCLTLCDPRDCSLPGSSDPWSSPGKNTGVGSHSLLQGIFRTQGLNPGLLHCRQILYFSLSHQGSPHVTKHLSKHLLKFATTRVKPKVSYGLWVIMMCHCGFICYKNPSLWYRILITGKTKHVWRTYIE